MGQSVLRAQLGALIFGVEGVENYALTAPAADVAAAGGRVATTGHTDGSGTGGDGMSYGAYLRELLRPLRIYGLEGTANGGELEAQGRRWMG
ncbi:MAG: hypothetical protein ACLRNQ_03985 [Flavonifractor plautii]